MNNETLNDISRNIESLTQNRESLVHAFVQTGLDEIGLIATVDGYLNLARKIIDFVTAAQNGRLEEYIYGEIQGPADASIGYVFSGMSDAALDSAFLAKTEGEAVQLLRYFQHDFSDN